MSTTTGSSETTTASADQATARAPAGRGLVLGAGLVALGLIALVTSFSFRSTITSRVQGGNAPINAKAVDPLVVTAENSPTLVANPAKVSNLVVAHRVDRPLFGCGVSASFDAGATWSQAQIPTPAGKTISCFGPDAAFGPDGVLYVTFTSFAKVAEDGNAPDGLWVVRSDDGGRTFRPAVMVSGPLAFQARVAADPKSPGRVFATWVQVAATSSYGFAGPGNPIVVSRSEDGGGTWSTPVPVSPAGRKRVVAPTPVAAGPLYVAYLDVGDDRLDYEGANEGRGGPAYDGPWSLVVSRSDDGGRTWHETVVERAVTPAARFIQLSVPSPALAVRGADVYLAYTDARLGDPDVYVWRSTDGAVHWDPPRLVDDARAGDGRSEYLPAVTTAPDGRVDVVYYDRRDDPKDVRNKVSLQSSFDRGRTFSARVKMSDLAFDSTLGFGSERGLPDLGSRLGSVSTDGGVLAVWADTRNGSPEIQKQVLARAAVSITRTTSSARAALQPAGAVALAAGLACVAFSLVVRRRGGPVPAGG